MSNVFSFPAPRQPAVCKPRRRSVDPVYPASRPPLRHGTPRMLYLGPCGAPRNVVQVRATVSGHYTDYYPLNPLAAMLCDFAGRSHLSSDQIDQLRNIGFAIEVVEPKPIPSGRQVDIVV